MANFVSNYGSHLAYHADAYFNYDLLKMRIYEIEEGVSHEVSLDRKKMLSKMTSVFRRKVPPITMSTSDDISRTKKDDSVVGIELRDGNTNTVIPLGVESQEAEVVSCEKEVDGGDSNNDFENMFCEEVDRVNGFLLDKLADLEMHVLANTHSVLSFKEKKYAKAQKPEKKTEEASLKRSLTAAYQDANSLESFRLLNLTAMIKIVRKRDKVLGSKFGDCYPELMDACTAKRFIGEYQGMISEFQEKTVIDYADALSKGDLMEARCKLINSKGDIDYDDMWYMGLKLGMLVVLLVWFLWDEAVGHVGSGKQYNMWKDPALHLYSFFGNIIIYQWLFGVTVYFWSKARINYSALLGLHKSHNKRYDQIYSEAAQYSIVFLVNIIMYSKSQRQLLGEMNAIPPYTFPLLLTVIFLLYFAYKYKYQLSERQGVFTQSVVFTIITAPFATVSFRDTYAADVLTSFVKVLSSGTFGACYLISASYDDSSASLHDFGYCQSPGMASAAGLLAVLPLWWRFAQCLHMVYVEAKEAQVLVWPHSFNMLKYFLGLIITIISLSFPLNSSESGGAVFSFQIVMATLLIVATCYSTWWDVRIDWGLLDNLPSLRLSDKGMISLSIPENSLLREKLMYKDTRIYYIAIVTDFIMRALWVISLIPQNVSTPYSVSLKDTLFPFLAAIEQYRRCQWGCLRVEWEHIKRNKDSENLSREPGSSVELAKRMTFVGFGLKEHTSKKGSSGLAQCCSGDETSNFYSPLIHAVIGGFSLLGIYLLVSMVYGQ